MGWLSWLRAQEDPLSDLDPSLRQFLEQQSPSQSQQPSKPTASSPTTKPTSSSAQSQDPSPQDQEPHVPPESLFPDGRYAHLWSTYRPAPEIEEAGKSDSEKLRDISSSVRERQSELARAAAENCSEEQWAVHECFRTGGWKSRMSMCREENRALERCVGMQTRFLRALGYQSLYARSEEESERIQMHADKLYHRMLEQEAAINEARERGEPMPEFAPLIRTREEGEEAVQRTAERRRREGRSDAKIALDDAEYCPAGGELTLKDLPRDVQEKLHRNHLEGKQGMELEIAKHEIDQEIATGHHLVTRLNEHHKQERRERLHRQWEGSERFSDKIKKIFDMRDWSSVDQEEIEKMRQQQKQHADEHRG